MKPESPESGLDELMRLYQETADEAQRISNRQQERTEQRQKVQEVVKGLRDISISVAVEQLSRVATPEVVEEVNSLQNKQDNEDLRKIISNLTSDLEESIDSIGRSDPAAVGIEGMVRILVILIELYFSLQ